MGQLIFFVGTEDIKDNMLDHTALPASKAFNEFHPRRLMSSALPGETCRASLYSFNFGSLATDGVVPH